MNLYKKSAFLFILFLLILSSCSSDNEEFVCIDIHDIDLLSSTCLAEDVLNICNSFDCDIPVDIFFFKPREKCYFFECNQIECSFGTLSIDEATGTIGYNNFSGNYDINGEQGEYNCSPFVE
ncbi:MAG: hypothetical protein GTO02_00995 [Candidatus Dadabacteria bacterium]|nr:hypothetical protein [Candidatus Dadabacteria bacterium]NIQ13019.1 hypothetical protein [Candidatus Dadabacteria bacterium]